MQCSLLNKVFIGEVDHAVATLLRSRFVNQNDDSSYPAYCVHIFAKNKPVEEHNRIRLNQIGSPLFCIKATDKVSPELRL